MGYGKQPEIANRIIKQLKTFKKVNGLDDSYTPYKAAYEIEGIDYTVNDEGILCCPHDPALLMKREGNKVQHPPVEE